MFRLRPIIIFLFVLVLLFPFGSLIISGQNARTHHGEQEARFKAGAPSPLFPLGIDPLLSWNTFLGGSGSEEGLAMTVDTSGNIYIVGCGDATWGSPVDPYVGDADAFVVKLDRSGALQWNTFLGSSSYEEGRAIALDASGNIYVAGISMESWGSPVNPHSGSEDVFVAKLNNSGALQWNTFLGSSSYEGGLAMALNTSGKIYVTGYSEATWGSPVNPHSGGADAFVAKLNSSGVLQWNTFLGSTGIDEGRALAMDASGNVCVAGWSNATWGSPVDPYVGGQDAFIAVLNSSGVLQWSTFLGSSGGDWGHALAVDASDNIYVAGQSYAAWGSPVRPYSGGADAFAAKLNGSGALQWNTFLGSSVNDTARGLDLDTGGNVYISGQSYATWGSPINPYTGADDAFAAKLNNSGVLKWNTFLGSSGSDFGYAIAWEKRGNICIAGKSSATWGSPLLPYAGGSDAFVAKIVEKDDFVGTWDGQGIYYRNTLTGKWIKLASPANIVAAGDLGGDSIDDLITVFPSAAGVWTRSSSSGTWTKLSSTTAKHISSGDMNGDGRVDLLATWDGVGVYYRNSISGAWTKIAQPANLLASGDLDGDSKDDPIVIFPTPAGVWVKYSKTAIWAKLSSISARDIASGDMNGDGRDDLVGAWDGTGVFYRNSISGAWVKMSQPADQVMAGEIDGDGADDLITSSAPGVYFKSSKTGKWTKLGNSVTDMATGLMRGGIWGSSAFGFIPLDMPIGGYAGDPVFLSIYEDLSEQGPGGWRFAAQEEENLVPLETGEALVTPGPGDPGFTWLEQEKLIPQETATKEKGTIREKKDREKRLRMNS